LGLASWTFVIVRTERGEKVFEAAVEAGMLRTRAAEEEPFALTLLTKLSKRKQENSPRT